MGVIVNFLRSRASLSAFVLLGGYWIIERFFATHDLIEFLRILQSSVAVAVVTAYSPHAFRALQSVWPSRVGQLSMGIALGFTSLMLSGIWFLLWRLGGQPPWMLTSSIAGFLIWMSVLAGVLHLTAPGAVNNQIPRRNFVILGASFGAAVMVAGLLAWTEPEFEELVQRIEPYVRY